MAKRETKITTNYLMHPEGSVLIETGKTKVICTATVEKGVPPFLRNAVPAQGWMTAEYSMLPRATHSRNRRAASKGKISGRTAEIQRLIGRSLRAVVDLTKFPGYQIYVDCDVIQADGGTRTAAITGACVALNEAFKKMIEDEIITENPMREFIAAISVGIVHRELILDLCYNEDSQADTDMNIVMTESGKFIEIQGTAEQNPFTYDELNSLLELAKKGIDDLIKIQKQCC